MKVILDTDPGIDDAMAYFYGLGASEIDLVGLTTIFGNVTIEDATKNALWLTEFSGAKAGVFKGAARPLSIKPNPPSDFVHGPHGFGDVTIGEVLGTPEAEAAADYLVRAARETPGEITLCAVGPLTNVGLAIQKDPEFVSNLKQLVIMGGSLDAGGNVSDYAEANFWNDPHAANIVVNAPGGGDIVIVGLDVTSKINFTAAHFENLAKASPKSGGFLRDIGQFYMAFYKTKINTMSCHMHDPTAMMVCIKPEIMEMTEVALEVVTDGEKIGMLARRDDTSGRKCRVCVGVKADAVIADFMAVVGSLP